MRRSLRVGFAATVAAVLGVTAIAGAHRANYIDTSKDVGSVPPGAKKDDFDFVRATVGHGHNGRLKHFAHVERRTSGAGPPVLYINVPGRGPGLEYNVIAGTPARGVGRIVNLKTGRSGRAGVVPHDIDTWRFIINRAQLGRFPRGTYQWFFAFSRVYGGDRLPNQGLILHRLSRRG